MQIKQYASEQVKCKICSGKGCFKCNNGIQVRYYYIIEGVEYDIITTSDAMDKKDEKLSSNKAG